MVWEKEEDKMCFPLPHSSLLLQKKRKFGFESFEFENP